MIDIQIESSFFKEKIKRITSSTKVWYLEVGLLWERSEWGSCDVE